MTTLSFNYIYFNRLLYGFLYLFNTLYAPLYQLKLFSCIPAVSSYYYFKTLDMNIASETVSYNTKDELRLVFLKTISTYTCNGLYLVSLTHIII